MQKFGLQRNASSRYSAIELEIVKEQATVLGRAGKKLRLSLENYQHKHNDIKANEALIEEISNNVWELIIQREFIGFVDGNLGWIRSNYVIPEEAIRMLGKKN